MTINLPPTQVFAVLGVLLALLMMWRSGTRRGRRAADAAHGASRVASLAGHLLGTAGVIVGVQWAAITYASGSTLFWVVLALPALITAHALTRSVASMDTYWRGDRR
jgi:cytochrome b561